MIKNIDSEAFGDDLRKIILDLEHITVVSELAEQYDLRIMECLDKHAPAKSKWVTVREHLPWYNNELLDIKKKKRKVERTWRKNRNVTNWLVYKKLSKSLRYAIAVAKWRYLYTEVMEATGDPRRLFKMIFQMIGRTKENPMPESKVNRNWQLTLQTIFSQRYRQFGKTWKVLCYIKQQSYLIVLWKSL